MSIRRDDPRLAKVVAAVAPRGWAFHGQWPLAETAALVKLEAADLDDALTEIWNRNGAQLLRHVGYPLGRFGRHVGAEQGLLVAWDGVSGPARQSLQRERFRVRLWNSLDVLNAVLRTYEKLPEEIRTDLPLQRVWLLAK